ncbi:MAG: hypothetical protein ABFS46_03110 [Myxococcota bacterium]
MRGKRIPLLSSFMHFVTIATGTAAVCLIFYTYAWGPAGGSFDLRSIEYTFRDLHQNGLIFYPLLGTALLSWMMTPSPRTSTRGR